MTTILKKLVCGLSLLICLPVWVFAVQPFIIRDIRLQGLERISAGTVFNYLPLKVGDELNDGRSAEAVRALFKTGFFKDVQLERDGSALVVVLAEREAIAEISISGNDGIKTDKLLEGLEQIGFAEGEIYDPSLLDQVKQELQRQYFSQGKYGIKLDADVSQLGDNRVAISIDVAEGETAKIKQINIVGNKTYKDKKLLKRFESTTPKLLSFFTKSDQYSRQKIGADLETLKSFYLDNGFINFNIDSTQVSITPDKRDVYITININEGERYTVSEVKLAGELIVPETELFPLVESSKNAQFSRQAVTQSTTNITERLGGEGYAFANVNAVPDIDEENNTVALTYFVDPGQRVYVRRINFEGNTKTRDEVLRREMRQMEGGWISTSQIQRSKERLQRLGFFEDVNVETPAVPGTTDQVDVDFSVTERASGNLMLGLGFSQTQGLIFNTNISQNNFLGSGKRVKFQFNNSDVNRRFGLGYTNPYFTIDGISQGFDLSYNETDAANANITRFDSRVASAGINFGIPITEFQSLNLAANYENTKIEPGTLASDEVRSFVDEQGENFDVLRLRGSFAYDTRNKAIFPDQGVLHRLRSEVAIPGGDLRYFKVDYDTRWFISLLEDYTLMFKGNVGYGDGYGDTDELPFFENFYAGGPRSVRGFRENTLGPRDSTNRALGGNIKLIGNAELILPIPFLSDVRSVRITGFFDAGNVYAASEDIDLGEMRLSTGLSGIWMSPFGVLSVSLAAPIKEEKGDDTQAFQFTFGTSF